MEHILHTKGNPGLNLALGLGNLHQVNLLHPFPLKKENMHVCDDTSIFASIPNLFGPSLLGLGPVLNSKSICILY